MWDWISKLAELDRDQKSAVFATVVACAGSAPREVGAKMLVTENQFWGSIGGGHLEELVLEEARALLSNSSQNISVMRTPLCVRTGQCCGGSVDVLLEVIHKGPLLYLFGAGHVGQAVARVFQGTPWRVHVIDEREEWIHSHELPPSTKRHAGSWKDFVAKSIWDEDRVYVAVMTHSHDLDFDIIEEIIRRPARYIGLIGSTTKWSRFEHKLKQKKFTSDQYSRVQCPLGEPIGGKAPQEVAISLASACIKLFYQDKPSLSREVMQRRSSRFAAEISP